LIETPAEEVIATPPAKKSHRIALAAYDFVRDQFTVKELS
jgi:hypothetical protein